MGIVMLLVGLTNLLERRNVQEMHRTFNSIYHDRLVPATDIFYLTENLYKRRLLIEEFLYSEGPCLSVDSLTSRLNVHASSIDKLINKYSKTYLVKDESTYLKEFVNSVTHYNSVESQILLACGAPSKEKARDLYEKFGKQDLLVTIDQLEKLTRIQSSEGLAMMHGSDGIASNSSMILTLQIAVAIVMGIFIQGLIVASRATTTKDQPFHLN